MTREVASNAAYYAPLMQPLASAGAVTATTDSATMRKRRWHLPFHQKTTTKKFPWPAKKTPGAHTVNGREGPTIKPRSIVPSIGPGARTRGVGQGRVRWAQSAASTATTMKAARAISTALERLGRGRGRGWRGRDHGRSTARTHPPPHGPGQATVPRHMARVGRRMRQARDWMGGDDAGASGDLGPCLAQVGERGGDALFIDVGELDRVEVGVAPLVFEGDEVDDLLEGRLARLAAPAIGRITVAIGETALERLAQVSRGVLHGS
jgi:hypothetical protein